MDSDYVDREQKPGDGVSATSACDVQQTPQGVVGKSSPDLPQPEAQPRMTPSREGIPPVLSVDEFLDQSADWRSFAGFEVCAVLGQPIEHSKSPLLHNTGYAALGLDFTYVRVEAGTARDIRRLMESSPREGQGAVRGFSVTMPGKSAALELAQFATERASVIGSANTLIPQRDGSWIADNTDVDGILACLEELRRQGASELTGATAVVVGNGGTARPAVAALAQAGVSRVVVLARSERALNVQSLVENHGMEFSWMRLDEPGVAEVCAASAVVVSTIPSVGAQLVADALLQSASVIDVIYDPYPTPLLQAAADRGVPHADGLRMLSGQAERQFELFTGQRPPVALFVETVTREVS